jgi:hypothetical protein
VSARALQAHAAEALICPFTGSATRRLPAAGKGSWNVLTCVFLILTGGQAIGRSQVQSVYRFHFVIGFFVRGQSGQVLESLSVGATCRLLVFSDGACLWYRGLASIAAMTHISRRLATGKGRLSLELQARCPVCTSNGLSVFYLILCASS